MKRIALFVLLLSFLVSVNARQTPEGIQQDTITGFRDDFLSDTLAGKWTWNHLYATIRPKFEYNELLLSGIPKKGNKNGTALYVSSTSADYSYETRVTNRNSSLKGLTLYGDAQNLVAYGSRGDSLIIKTVTDGKEAVLYTNPLPVVSPYLKMEIVKGSKGSCLWSKDGKKWNKLELLPALDISGLMPLNGAAKPGLIHIGPSNEPARFSYFAIYD